MVPLAGNQINHISFIVWVDIWEDYRYPEMKNEDIKNNGVFINIQHVN